jgi:hypothetical protein
MQNRREYAYFRPVGPLRYMLTDRQGRERLGLYEYSGDGRLVLIGDGYGGKVVFWPSVDAIQEIIDGRAEVSGVLRRVRWTTPGLEAPDGWGRLLCRLWLSRELGGRIGRLPRLLPYLNLFYVFRQFRMVAERQ